VYKLSGTRAESMYLILKFMAEAVTGAAET
jgi:hypothetical protein